MRPAAIAIDSLDSVIAMTAADGDDRPRLADRIVELLRLVIRGAARR